MTNESLDKSTESIEQILLYADFGMGVVNKINLLKSFFDNPPEFLYDSDELDYQNQFDYFEHLCDEFNIQEKLKLQELDELGFRLNQIIRYTNSIENDSY